MLRLRYGKTRLVVSRLGRHDMDLFSIDRVYTGVGFPGEVVFAERLFYIPCPKWIRRLVWKRLGWAGY